MNNNLIAEQIKKDLQEKGITIAQAATVLDIVSAYLKKLDNSQPSPSIPINNAATTAVPLPKEPGQEDHPQVNASAVFSSTGVPSNGVNMNHASVSASSPQPNKDFLSQLGGLAWLNKNNSGK